MFRKFIPAILIATTTGLPTAAVITSPAVAQSQNAEQIRVRGSIISFTGTVLKVKTREGKMVDVTLAEGWTVSSVARAARIHRPVRIAPFVRQPQVLGYRV